MPQDRDLSDRLKKASTQLKKLAGQLSETTNYQPGVKFVKSAGSISLDPDKVLDFMLFFGKR